MGEESTTPVYIGKYEFEPLGEFEVVDHDITAVYADDIAKPMDYVRTIMSDQTITVRAFLQKKGLRGFYKAIGMPAYLRTEYLFPKKKRRGTARRKRKLRVYEQRFIKFVKDKYGDNLIGTQVTQTFIDEYAFSGPFEGEEH